MRQIERYVSRLFKFIADVWREPGGLLGSVSHLNIVFDEACGLDARLHIKADVHLDLCLLVCQLDDWHLRGKVLIIRGRPSVVFSSWTKRSGWFG